jgi:hypothetical protein
MRTQAVPGVVCAQQRFLQLLERPGPQGAVREGAQPRTIEPVQLRKFFYPYRISEESNHATGRRVT